MLKKKWIFGCDLWRRKDMCSYIGAPFLLFQGMYDMGAESQKIWQFNINIFFFLYSPAKWLWYSMDKYLPICPTFYTTLHFLILATEKIGLQIWLGCDDVASMKHNPIGKTMMQNSSTEVTCSYFWKGGKECLLKVFF